jgi:hypothetical protein
MKPARGASGVNHDFNFFNAAGEVWDGSAFVAWNDANYATYRVAATETGTSGRYPVPAPPTGAVEYELRVRGASLAASYVAYEGQTDAGVKADIRLGVAGRWTNLGHAAGRDDIGITDIP